MQNIVKLILLFLVLVGNIFAQENKLSTSISFVAMSMDYREYNATGNILDSEESSFNDLLGVEIEVKYLLSSSSSNYTELESTLMILSGYTDYVGSLRNDPSCSTYGCYESRTVNYLVDFDLGLKQTYRVTDKLELNYGIGLGYRFWERALSSSQVEDYIWYSLRTSLGMSYQLTKKLKLGTEFEYQYGFSETMYASDVGREFDLASANILQFSIPLVYSYNDKIDFVLEYIYTKQTIKESNHIVIGLFEYWEPASTAKNQYIKVGVDFKF